MDAKQPVGTEGSLEDFWRLYTYLGDKCDNYSRSTFEDIGLLFSTGALTARVPTSKLVTGDGINEWVPLVGFIAILFFTAIMGTMGLSKRSIIQFYMLQLARVEERIGERLAAGDGAAFGFARGWPEWQRTRYEPILQRFLLLFAVFLWVVPTITLWLGSKERLPAVIYLCAFVVAGGIYVSAATKLRVALST
jgi:hypothetical protein